MNTQSLWNQSRLAAPYLRASLSRSPLFKKVVSLFDAVRSLLEPCRIPVPVAVPVRRPRIVSSLMIAMLGLFVVGSAHAQAWDVQPNRGRTSPEWNWSTDGQLVEVSIQVDGSQTPLYTKNGAWDRSYFQAFRGRNYSVVVRNITGRRVGVLLAVDGLNVVNGERTRMASNEAMYVLDPYETANIRGWRTSLNEVRRFVFVDEERSYAERTNQANGDMGWIRVNTFRENRPLAWIPDYRYKGDERSNESGRPRAEAAPEARRDAAGKSSAQGELNGRRSIDDSNPGTGWGERSNDPVQQTDFRAERNATDRITLRYEYESGLRALGIYPVRDRNRNRTWEREHGDLGFSQPPTR